MYCIVTFCIIFVLLCYKHKKSNSVLINTVMCKIFVYRKRYMLYIGTDFCWLLVRHETYIFVEKQFLKFFYSRLDRNTTGHYTEDFPYLSLCGRERNFVRCDDLPIVFTELIHTDESDNDKAGGDRLLYAGGTLYVPFEPSQVMMLPDTGRVYHSGPVRTGGVGLIKSSLAIELSRLFQFEDGNTSLPTHLTWRDKTYTLSNEISAQLRECHRLLRP